MRRVCARSLFIVPRIECSGEAEQARVAAESSQRVLWLGTDIDHGLVEDLFTKAAAFFADNAPASSEDVLERAETIVRLRELQEFIVGGSQDPFISTETETELD